MSARRLFYALIGNEILHFINEQGQPVSSINIA